MPSLVAFGGIKQLNSEHGLIDLQAPSEEEDDEVGFQVVHGAASSTADLPASVQAALHALQVNQQQLDELATQGNQHRQKLQAAQAEVKQALATQRR